MPRPTQARRLPALLAAVLCPAALALEVSNEHLSMALPDAWQAPSVSRMSSSVTYAWRPGAGAQTQLQISIVDLPRWSREANAPVNSSALDECLSLFMTEVARGQRGFQLFPPESGTLDGKPMRKARWLGRGRDGLRTGVLHCAQADGRYYVIHMQDRVQNAVRSFAELNLSLQTLRFQGSTTPAVAPAVQIADAPSR